MAPRTIVALLISLAICFFGSAADGQETTSCVAPDPNPGIDMAPVIRAHIDALDPVTGGTVLLCPGDFHLYSSIKINGRANVTLAGTLLGNVRASRLRYHEPNGAAAIRLQGVVSSPTIRDLTIIGDVDSEAEAQSLQQSGIANDVFAGDSLIQAVYENVEATHLTIGIATSRERVDNQSENRNTIIRSCFVHDIYGTTSGQGYGIFAKDARNVLIEGNLVERAQRHSIYHSHGGNSVPWDRPRILSNCIVNHGYAVSQKDVKRACIVVNQSERVTVAHNTIINSSGYGISVEYSTDFGGGESRYISVIGNRFFDTAPAATDIWVTTIGPVYLWHNRGELDQAASYSCEDHGAPCSSSVIDVAGAGQSWDPTTGMAEADGIMFVMHHDNLHRVVPAYGDDPRLWSNYQYSPTVWAPNFQGMSAAGQHVFIMQNNLLHRVDANWPLAYTYSTTDWHNFNVLSASPDGNVYVLQDHVLHRVYPGPSNGSWPYDRSTSLWSAPEGLQAWDDFVYLADEPSPGMHVQYRVFPGADGTEWPYVAIDQEPLLAVESARLNSRPMAIVAYPNPYRDKIVLSWQQSSRSNVTFRIADVDGRVVDSVDLGQRDRGWQALVYLRRIEGGHALSAGVYWIVIRAGNEIGSRRLTLLP